MTNPKSSLAFLLFIACATVFILHTSQELPSVVASHFGSAGMANGFMPKDFYIRFMLAFVLGLPTVMTLLTWVALGRKNARINIPNRDYWLATERRAKTVAVLRAGLFCFGILLLTFLCFTHWLVVLANRAQPAHLEETWFLGGLGVFAAALLLWLIVLISYFRQGP